MLVPFALTPPREPAPAWNPRGVDDRDHRAENQSNANDEHPGERDVRIRVGHSPKDRMIVKQACLY